MNGPFLHRSEFAMIERGLDEGLTHEEISRRVGKPVLTVRRVERALRGDPEINPTNGYANHYRKNVRGGGLSATRR